MRGIEILEIVDMGFIFNNMCFTCGLNDTKLLSFPDTASFFAAY